MLPTIAAQVNAHLLIGGAVNSESDGAIAPGVDVPEYINRAPGEDDCYAQTVLQASA